jgi:hypothetical protein
LASGVVAFWMAMSASSSFCDFGFGCFGWAIIKDMAQVTASSAFAILFVIL